MESSRSKKSRSTGSESKLTRPSKPVRPELGDRIKSAPYIPPRRGSQPQNRASTSSQGGQLPRIPSRDGIGSALRSSHQSSECALATKSEGLKKQSSSRLDEIPVVTLVVLGARAVGKSTFIQNALNIRNSSNSPFSSSKVSLDGDLYRVQVLELSLDVLDYSSSRPIVWPRYVNNVMLPPIDGVFCLYDIAHQDSIAEVPELLAALSRSNLSCVLIASKCDKSAAEREVDPAFNSKVQSRFPLIFAAETTAVKPETQKRCVSNIVRIILSKSRNPSRSQSPAASRPRAATSELDHHLNYTPEQSRSHSRSKSDLPRLNSREAKTVVSSHVSQHNLRVESESESESEEADEESEEVSEDSENDDDESPTLPDPLYVDTSFNTQHRIRPSQPPTPMSSSGLLTNELRSSSDDRGSATPETPQSLYMATFVRPGTADTTDSQAYNTFLNMDDESQDESGISDGGYVQNGIEKLAVTDSRPEELGVSFADLVDRLLTLPNSKLETKFLPVFLCLYRAFATPGQLLTSMISRFENVDKSKSVQLIKAGDQLRYLQILARWTADYPGDFASATVRGLAASFVVKIGRSRQFAPAAKEISNNLETLAPDDDAGWAYHPRSSTGPLVSTSSRASPSKPSTSHNKKSSQDHSSGEDEPNPPPRHSGAPSTTSTLARTANTSSQSLANLITLESNRQKAQKLVPIPRTRLSKVHWHLFMDSPADDFAREVTRIDWTMYSAIRPREFIRHVKLSTEQKRRSNHVDNISLMVKHFNHLALFVSGMILLRDKPKHRAKALEKFMSVAWKIRQLNNYNSLGAIVAGLNGPEIQRLSMTRDLVPVLVQKDFLRLTILMSHGRSHATYRMAWENSFAERIPFIPLVRQDLTRAEIGNKTFVGPNGDKIHWKKFEIMGDVIVSIQRSQQEHMYKFQQRDDEIAKMILETKVLDCSEESADPRDELQKRSEQLEPTGVTVEGAKKKFDWFRR